MRIDKPNQPDIMPVGAHGVRPLGIAPGRTPCAPTLIALFITLLGIRRDGHEGGGTSLVRGLRRTPLTLMPLQLRPKHFVNNGLILVLFVLLLSLGLNGCSDDRPLPERLAADVEKGLMNVQTVEGRLNITTGPVTLQQKFWVQRPNLLRTETADGPTSYKGTIVVLNAKEGWLYNPALRMVTLVDRSKYDPTLAQEAGAGSMLERIPNNILALLRTNPAVNEIGGEEIAGRATRHIEIVVTGQNKDFPAGPLQLWLDKEFGYPLALTMSSGLQLRFTQVKFNQTIDPLTFTFVPPPGVFVQKVNP